MSDYNSFSQMEVDMNKFENLYNSYAKQPLNFGGGTMTVNALVNKYFPKKIKGGGNFFNDFRPQFSPTNINNMPDYTYNTLELQGIIPNNRA